MSYDDSWANWDEWAKAVLLWGLQAREKQLPPDGDWRYWVLMTGRGFGKTLTGAQWLSRKARTQPGGTFGIFAPTYGDVRDVCVEGSTGLLAVVPKSAVTLYNRSNGEIHLHGGSKIKMISADEPERARGWNFDAVWCDELGSWKRAETWTEGLVPATRKSSAQIVVTTTPRTTPLVRMLVDRWRKGDPAVRLTRGSTWENRANLSPEAVRDLELTYAGTRTGRQELEGELLDDLEGALWKARWIEDHRVPIDPATGQRQIDLGEFDLVVVAVDPSGGRAEGDETGLCVAGRHAWDRRYYVFASEGLRASPSDVLARVRDLYHDWHADRIVVEKNYGDAYLVALLHTLMPDYPFRMVNASRGKRTRAEPIAALYEQGRVRHFGVFTGTAQQPGVEDQMLAYTGGDGEKSPDRLDALVWALSALKEPTPRLPAPIVHVAEVPREDRSLLSAEL